MSLCFAVLLLPGPFLNHLVECSAHAVQPGSSCMKFFGSLNELCVYHRVERSAVKFNAERATRAALRPLLASGSVSNLFSFIWKAVKQAERSLERGAFKGGSVHAGNWIPTAIVGIAEEEKQDEYERLKGTKICQISEVIYSFILDDPDGSFKIPLPRYTAEVMRPVLEGISNAKQAKFARSWIN